MAFEDLQVPVSVKVDSAELKRLISEFDGTTEAAQKLEAQTLKVKSAIDSQRQAISVYNQANRVQNFEIIQSLRLVRSFTSVFSNLNQVYQTLLLRQISTTQTTVAQREALERLTEKSDNVVNALSILGEENEDVKDAFDGIIDSADDLSSEALQKYIDSLEETASKTKLTKQQQEFLNGEIKKLKEILEETKLEEEQKKWNDFFGIFTTGATAVGSVGTALLNLKTNGFLGGKSGSSGFIGPVKPSGGIGSGPPGGAGGAGLIGGTALIVSLAQFILHQMGIDPQSGNIPKTSFDTLNKMQEIVDKKSSITVNMYDTKLNSDVDWAKVAKEIENAQKIDKSRNIGLG